MSAAAALNRRDAVKSLMAACPEALVIAGLGSSAYDLFAAGDRDLNFICGAPWVAPRPWGWV